MSTPVALVFDFDGVLCDATDECLLVTWLAGNGLGAGAFSAATLANLPLSFRTAFARCRVHARHVGHLLLAFSKRLAETATQREFDAIYAELQPASVEAFVERLEWLRAELCGVRSQPWLQAQRLYPGIGRLLRRLAQGYYIVTAKDAKTVRAVLSQHRVVLRRDRIAGGCRDKLRAYAVFRAHAGVAKDAVWVLDDNVPNGLAAAKSGYRALWADWGYHTEEHAAAAACLGLPRVSLGRFLTEPWRAYASRQLRDWGASSPRSG